MVQVPPAPLARSTVPAPQESKRVADIAHNITAPQGHGYQDQKYGKGNRAPVHVPGGDGASHPTPQPAAPPTLTALPDMYYRATTAEPHSASDTTNKP